jgi:uncharacterized protein (TIGR03437 family)
MVFCVANCPIPVSIRRGGTMVLLGVCVCLWPFHLRAQTSGSITTQPLPITGFSAVIDATGNTFFTGRNGIGPVTTGAAQTRPGGGTCFESAPPIGSIPVTCSDAYVGKVGPAGDTVFGTYLGGSTADGATALAVDAEGSVFLTGFTGGSFPTTANAAIAASTTAKVFAAKLSADGSRFLYSTYLPDTAANASSIAIDAEGAAYIAGRTNSGNTYILKLSSDGGSIVYDTILAGSKVDAAPALLVDGGDAIVAGATSSPDFPVSPGVVQKNLAGIQNLFVARLDSTGRLIRSTYLGGSGTDLTTTVRTDATGNIYIAGSTTSPDFPTTPGAFQPGPIVPLWSDGAPFGFVTKLSADFRALVYSSYVMTADFFPGVTALAVTPAGDAYLAGNTGAGFPITASAPQACFQGPLSVFVAHLDPRGTLQDATYVGANADVVAGLSTAADGTIQLAWSSFSAPNSALSRIRFGGGGWKAPVCLSPTVLNAATFYGDDKGVIPGEFVALTGFGIGPDTGVAYQPDADGKVPRELAGVQVLFDGEPAPVLFAQSGQVNAQAPFELAGKATATISLVYNGTTAGSMTVRADAGRPGIFRLHPATSFQAVAVNQDGTVNGASSPADRGSMVTLWGTGFPSLTPPCETGGLNPSQSVNLFAEGFVVSLGGEGGQVVYAGSAPGELCGVMQINMLLSPSAAAGAHLRPQFGNPMTYQSGASAIGATIAVK